MNVIWTLPASTPHTCVVTFNILLATVVYILPTIGFRAELLRNKTPYSRPTVRNFSDNWAPNMWQPTMWLQTQTLFTHKLWHNWTCAVTFSFCTKEFCKFAKQQKFMCTTAYKYKLMFEYKLKTNVQTSKIIVHHDLFLTFYTFHNSDYNVTGYQSVTSLPRN